MLTKQGPTRLDFRENDGGRLRAGFRGRASDCVVRAIAIAGGLDYREVYDDLAYYNRRVRFRKQKGTKNRSPRNGVYKKAAQGYFRDHGWQWIPFMTIGSGCQIHMRYDELPWGPMVVVLSRHYSAVVDRTLHDLEYGEVVREGTRCVYGIYRPPGWRMHPKDVEAFLATVKANQQVDRAVQSLQNIQTSFRRILL